MEIKEEGDREFLHWEGWDWRGVEEVEEEEGERR